MLIVYLFLIQQLVTYVIHNMKLNTKDNLKTFLETTIYV